MNDSIFTKIIKGEVPGVIVWQDEKVFILMDKFPTALGQALVIPKEQIDYMFTMPDPLYSHIWLVTKRLANAMDKAFSPQRVCTVVEGFDVPHVHVRVYPIREGETLNAHHGSIADDAELRECAEKIKMHFTL